MSSSSRWQAGRQAALRRRRRRTSSTIQRGKIRWLHHPLFVMLAANKDSTVARSFSSLASTALPSGWFGNVQGKGRHQRLLLRQAWQDKLYEFLVWMLPPRELICRVMLNIFITRAGYVAPSQLNVLGVECWYDWSPWGLYTVYVKTYQK